MFVVRNKRHVRCSQCRLRFHALSFVNAASPPDAFCLPALSPPSIPSPFQRAAPSGARQRGYETQSAVCANESERHSMPSLPTLPSSLSPPPPSRSSSLALVLEQVAELDDFAGNQRERERDRGRERLSERKTESKGETERQRQ